MLDGVRRFTKEYSDMWWSDDGDWLRYSDVAAAWDTKLAAIRAAVEAERDCVIIEQNIPTDTPDHEIAEICRNTDTAAAALDALLVAP